jgi:predicted methyltransferase
LALAAIALVLGACGPTAPAPPAAPGAAVATGSTKETGTLSWAVGGDWRIPAWTARDAARHPAETLGFFGVKGSDTVVELWPGGGYYTAILGPYLRAGGGHLIAAQMESTPENAPQLDAFQKAFVSKPDIYGAIQQTTASKTAPGIASDGTVDVVLTFRNIHNWMSDGYADKIFADAFRALKPGGVLGVEEHRLPSRGEQDPTAGNGYVKETYVIQLAEAAGFKLAGRSEINANPKDKADHPLGVWMLPPTLRTPAPGSDLAKTYDADVYKAIGESDRMTLKFLKPASAAAPASPPSP